MSMIMLVLVARARQQPMQTLKQWRQWFWIIVESLERGCWGCWHIVQLMPSNFVSITVFTGLGPRWLFPPAKTKDTNERKAFCYDCYQKARFRSASRKKRCCHIVRLMSSNFYGCFSYETCGREECFKIAKFWAETISQEMLTRFNNDPDLLKKVITGDESWMYGHDIKIKAQSYQWKRPEEISYKIEKWTSSSVKCEGLAHCFLRLQWCGAWCILALRSYGQ